MPLAGTPMLPRDAALMLHDAGWVNVENLTKMLATCMAESQLYSHAWHYNDPKDKGDGSTDWGFYQLNDGNKGGESPITDANGMPQPVAGGIKTLAQVRAHAQMACDPHKATPAARALYVSRGFQPWAAARSAFNKYGPKASYAVRAMTHVMFGWPAP